MNDHKRVADDNGNSFPHSSGGKESETKATHKVMPPPTIPHPEGSRADPAFSLQAACVSWQFLVCRRTTLTLCV